MAQYEILKNKLHGESVVLLILENEVPENQYLLHCKGNTLKMSVIDAFVANGFFIEKDPLDVMDEHVIYLRKVQEIIRLGCFKLSTTEFMNLYHEAKNLQLKHLQPNNEKEKERVF